MSDDSGRRWLFLWNAGLLCGLVGLPALMGFLAGGCLEASPDIAGLPWRLIFVVLGVSVGGVAAWRTLLPGATRPRE